MRDITDQINNDFRRLLGDMDKAKADYDQFLGALQSRGYREGSAVCMKPYFIDEKRLDYIRHSIEILNRAITKVINLYYDKPEMQDDFCLTPDEHRIAMMDKAKVKSLPIIKYNAYLGKDYLQYMNFEGHDLQGFMFTDAHGESFGSTDVYGLLHDRYGLHRDPIMPHFLRILLLVSHTLGKGASPVIAFAGTKSSSETEEIASVTSWLNSLDYKTVTGEFSEWKCDEDGVIAPDGSHPSIFYRCGKISDWLDNFSLVETVVDSNVCILNPFVSVLIQSKSIPALLQRKDIQELLDSEERKIISETIPWTCFVAEGKDEDSDEEEIDLLPYICENREDLVLKSCYREGKIDVVIGRDVSAEEWKKTLDEIIVDSEKKYLVQSFVAIDQDTFPVFGSEVEFLEKEIEVSFFSFGGLYSGGVAEVKNWGAEGESVTTSILRPSEYMMNETTTKIPRL